MLLASSSLALRSMFEDFIVGADRIRLGNWMEMDFMLTVEERISSCVMRRDVGSESNTEM